MAHPRENDARGLIELARGLHRATQPLVFGPPITHVYQPLEYAFASHSKYLELYGSLGADTLLIGMNPGPFGMVQTGVPFGDIALTRDWLGIEAVVERPRDEHPKRPIEGFGTTRGEVSGQRLWGWARDVYGRPEKFFARFFVWNYCPLAFLEASGRNRTPDKLPRAEREALFGPCDEALRELTDRLRPRHIVGIGRFAFDRLAALGDIGPIAMAPHPSPASPAANRGWRPLFEAALRAHGVELP